MKLTMEEAALALHALRFYQTAKGAEVSGNTLRLLAKLDESFETESERAIRKMRAAQLPEELRNDPLWYRKGKQGELADKVLYQFDKYNGFTEWWKGKLSAADRDDIHYKLWQIMDEMRY